MGIEAALFARLTGWPAVAALVADRVYPMRAPQSAAAPFVRYQRISGPRVRSLAGPSGMANPRFQVDAVALTYDGARQLADAVRAALDGWRGEVAGVRVHGASLGTDRDDLDASADPVLHRVSADFTLLHSE